MSGYRGYIKVFSRDRAKLREMLLLRYKGWPSTTLGLVFNVDHTTILHHCKIWGVKPKGNVQVEPTRMEISAKLKMHNATAYQMMVDTGIIKRYRVGTVVSSLKYQHILDDEFNYQHKQKSYKEYLRESRMREHVKEGSKIPAELYKKRVRLERYPRVKDTYYDR